MQFYGFTQSELADAADRLTYPAKVYFSHTSNKGRAINGVLRVRNSKLEGARLSPSGRHTPAASWEAHRDFMLNLFAINPNGRIKTSLADYRGADDFEQKFRATAQHSVGPMYCPQSFESLSV